MVHGRDLAGQEFVVLDPECNRGVAVVGCGLDAHHSRTAAHAYPLRHRDLCRHRQHDLDRLSFAQRKIRPDERSPRAQIHGEPVPRLSIAGL